MPIGTSARTGGTAAYVRVSSRAQDHATQRSAIERAASARGETIDFWYAETLSGKTVARPVLRDLRNAVRRGEIRKLYLFRLDRLTRSGIADTLNVLAELKKNGCQVKTIADDFDLEGPTADVVVAVLAWAAKLERIRINENIAAARERVESAGGAWGRPRRVTSVQLSQITELREKKLTARAISAATGVPRSTVVDILSGKRLYARGGLTSEKPAENEGAKKGVLG